MHILRPTVLIAILFAGSCLGASKEIMELQRDIAQLQSQMQALQSSQDQKLAAIQALVTQSLDAAVKANTSVSVLAATVNQTLERELKTQMTPVAGLAAKVENTNNDVAEVRNSVADLNSSMNKILQRLGQIQECDGHIAGGCETPPLKRKGDRRRIHHGHLGKVNAPNSGVQHRRNLFHQFGNRLNGHWPFENQGFTLYHVRLRLSA